MEHFLLPSSALFMKYWICECSGAGDSGSIGAVHLWRSWGVMCSGFLSTDTAYSIELY